MIKLEKKKYKVSTMLDSKILPSLQKTINVQNTTKAFIEDYEGLFIGYGRRENCYPYREQNQYMDEKDQEIDVIILENDILYAEFLPSLGGRLWKLINKEKNQDVLYHNDVIRFRNLALRNAWFSGGVEWNIGIIGHTPYTCENLYAGKFVNENNVEVLRFYEFERVREVYYQIDFWLDKDKLYTKVCIHNTNDKAVPMYWWSNIATPEFKGGRVIVPADSAYNNSDGIGISKSPIPFDNGVDVSYPENIRETIDYFYDIKDNDKKFIANVNSEGKGLLQYSSSRLKGRKLFSWGHVKGSKHWQEFLTESAGDYVEIQAGLGKTQYECIPMPPKTTWKWVECYTLVDLKSPIDSEYNVLVDEVSSLIDSEYMDKLCVDTDKTITYKKAEVMYKGNGYGHINDMINHNCPKHLEFFTCKETSIWENIIKTGILENIDECNSFLIGDSYKKLLQDNEKQNANNWLYWYELALIEYDKNNYWDSYNYAVQSILLTSNYQNNHLLFNLKMVLNHDNYDYYAEKIIKLKNDNFSVVEDIFKALIDKEKYDLLIKCYDFVDNTVKDNDRIKLYLAYSLLQVGSAKEAENILYSNGGLFINDYREGDKMLNNLYRGIREKLYGEDRRKVVVPIEFDYVVVDRE